MKFRIALFAGALLAVIACGGGGGGVEGDPIDPPRFLYYQRESGADTQLVQFDVAAKTKKVIFTTGPDIWWIKVSPNRKKLLFWTGGDFNVLNTDGSGHVVLPDLEGADWITDDLLMIATAHESKVHTVKPDGTGMSAVIFDAEFDNGSIRSLDVNPQGTKVAFSHKQFGFNSHIFTMNLDGTALIDATGRINEDLISSWSPDGTELVVGREFTGADGQGLWLVKPDGTDMRPFVTAGRESWPNWGANGRIYFNQRQPDLHSDVWSMNPDGTDRQPEITDEELVGSFDLD